MTNGSELLPCPFCGNKPSMFDGRIRGRNAAWRVVCSKCQASLFPATTKKQAIIDWNRRWAGAEETETLDIKHDDGCPKEVAVLKRFWREHNSKPPKGDE